uniref:Uncharacterized protein n=1 Tax=Timema douglasi TaxID=61478 RepID=A0A7R8VT10_TIMDO|nr:unnamed protein product [Timema douglasi]
MMKKFGATQCSDCGIVYQQGDPDDEMSHLNFHNSSKSLKFAGWKQERVVGEYGNGRVVLITPNDSKVWCKKAADVVEVADKDLGYAESGLNISNSKFENHTVHTAWIDTLATPVTAYRSVLTVCACLSAQVYLYIEDRQVVGCLVAEHVTEAHRLLSSTGLDTCSEEVYPVKCGISRIWTLINCRRRGIATRLVNCMSTSSCLLVSSFVAASMPVESVGSCTEKECKTIQEDNPDLLVTGSSVHCDDDTRSDGARPCMTRGLSFCCRGNFIYGYILSSGEFAFSVPTVSGKGFASKYMGTPHFLDTGVETCRVHKDANCDLWPGKYLVTFLYDGPVCVISVLPVSAYSAGRAKLFKHACTAGCIGVRCAAPHTLTSWSTAAENITINSPAVSFRTPCIVAIFTFLGSTGYHLHTLTTPEPAYVFSPISLPYPQPLDPRDRRLTTTVARKLDFDETKPVTAKPQ